MAPVHQARSRVEDKLDNTTAAAKSIIAEETAERHAKTARLKAARLEGSKGLLKQEKK